MIDTRLSYKEHLEYANKKAAATARSLARIVLNTRGPRQERRKLIASVVTSQVLYAAPVWAKAATTPSYMSGVARTHRLYATRISCAFRAISEEAALVIAGLVPVQELVGEAEEVEETVTTNLGAISRWQKSPLLERRHGQVDFYLTQILSGHGCFRSYLQRRTHATSYSSACGS
ncbi:uncharacterized protein [Drosophila suzukii]|uniref:Uncharacterized protein n=1 Tax=Drosophila suzukii TaxID=28584 RepID=A0ABM4TXB8_DROSZ